MSWKSPFPNGACSQATSWVHVDELWNNMLASAHYWHKIYIYVKNVPDRINATKMLMAVESQQSITSWPNWQWQQQADVYTINWWSTIHMTLKMTSAQVAETSVKVNNNSFFRTTLTRTITLNRLLGMSGHKTRIHFKNNLLTEGCLFFLMKKSSYITTRMSVGAQ